MLDPAITKTVFNTLFPLTTGAAGYFTGERIGNNDGKMAERMYEAPVISSLKDNNQKLKAGLVLAGLATVIAGTTAVYQRGKAVQASKKKPNNQEDYYNMDTKTASAEEVISKLGIGAGSGSLGYLVGSALGRNEGYDTASMQYQPEVQKLKEENNTNTNWKGLALLTGLLTLASAGGYLAGKPKAPRGM